MLWFTLESFYFKGMVERFDRENDWLEMSEDYAKVKNRFMFKDLSHFYFFAIIFGLVAILFGVFGKPYLLVKRKNSS